MNDLEKELTNKVTAGVVLAAVLGFLPWLWRRFAAWLRKPSKSSLIQERQAAALEGLTLANQKICTAIDGINGTLVRMNANMTDIINQQAIQSAASRIMFSESPVARWVCNELGECIQTNAKLREMFGMTADEMRGWGWLDAIPPEFRKGVVEAFKRIYNPTEESHYEQTYPIRKENQYHSITSRAVEVVKGADGKSVIAVYGICAPAKFIKDAA